MPHNKDILWKGLLEWVFDDLLRFVLPDVDQFFDLNRGFEFLDKELARLYADPETESKVKEVDSLVKVFRKNGGEQWVLVHLEVQGETRAEDRPFFGKRMFRYFYRIFDHYEMAPAAIAIFTGPDGHKLPDRYEFNFMNTELCYRFNTIRIRDYPEETLIASDNPFALVILIAQKALLQGRGLDKQLLEEKLFIFRRLYENGLLDRRKLQAILQFLDNYIRFEDKEMIRIFKERVDLLTGKKNIMDIFELVAQMKLDEARQEGVQEGEQVANEKFVHQLLAKTEFSDEKIAELAGINVNQVAAIRNALRVK